MIECMNKSVSSFRKQSKGVKEMGCTSLRGCQTSGVKSSSFGREIPIGLPLPDRHWILQLALVLLILTKPLERVPCAY